MLRATFLVADRPDPSAGIVLGGRPERLATVLSDPHLAALLAAAEQCAAGDVLRTIAFTGLRVGEAVSLEVGDVNSSAGTLRVRRGKGYKQRLVPLPHSLLPILRRAWQRQRHQRWIFLGSRGKPLNAGTVQDHCQRAVRLAKIPYRVTPHTLRHTFASRLLEAGLNLVEIQRLLGHGSLSTTAKYLHLRTEPLRRAADALDPPVTSRWEKSPGGSDRS